MFGYGCLFEYDERPLRCRWLTDDILQRLAHNRRDSSLSTTGDELDGSGSQDMGYPWARKMYLV